MTEYFPSVILFFPKKLLSVATCAKLSNGLFQIYSRSLKKDIFKVARALKSPFGFPRSKKAAFTL